MKYIVRIIYVSYIYILLQDIENNPKLNVLIITQVAAHMHLRTLHQHTDILIHGT
jgi:hypothetical protein